MDVHLLAQFISSAYSWASKSCNETWVSGADQCRCHVCVPFVVMGGRKSAYLQPLASVIHRVEAQAPPPCVVLVQCAHEDDGHRCRKEQHQQEAVDQRKPAGGGTRLAVCVEIFCKLSVFAVHIAVCTVSTTHSWHCLVGHHVRFHCCTARH